MQRRNINVFGLSFLDIMFCGFGSVILLVMIVNSNMIQYREQINSELQAEANRIEQELQVKQVLFFELQNSRTQNRANIARIKELSAQVLQTITRQLEQLSGQEKDSRAVQEHINKLQSDIQALEDNVHILRARANEQGQKTGPKIRKIIGEGDRQYLTGLKMGGKRILVLLDRSASMLDEKIIEIIVKRNQTRKTRQTARKWQRAIATVEWLLSQLALSSQYQVLVFNQQADFLIENKDWLNASDAGSMNKLMHAIGKLVPENGTSLYQAFQAIKTMQPRPDNVFLITDGLPTLGTNRASTITVTGEQRMAYFTGAIKEIPPGIPINTILLPIEGDPMAAPVFWKLAMQTKGSFVSPAKDWP